DAGRQGVEEDVRQQALAGADAAPQVDPLHWLRAAAIPGRRRFDALLQRVEALQHLFLAAVLLETFILLQAAIAFGREHGIATAVGGSAAHSTIVARPHVAQRAVPAPGGHERPNPGIMAGITAPAPELPDERTP